MKRKRYVAIDVDGNIIGFSCANEPRRDDFGEQGQRYIAFIGPFRTRRAQFWAMKYGKSNPHFRTVDDAERLSKLAD